MKKLNLTQASALAVAIVTLSTGIAGAAILHPVADADNLPAYTYDGGSTIAYRGEVNGFDAVADADNLAAIETGLDTTQEIATACKAFHPVADADALGSGQNVAANGVSPVSSH